MIEARKIKQLKSQRNLMYGDAQALKVSLNNIQKEYQSKLDTIKEMDKQIKKFEDSGNIRVSEHAIVRYLERIKGFDILEIEKEILNEEVRELIGKLGGNGTYPNKDFRVIIKNYTITTVTKQK